MLRRSLAIALTLALIAGCADDATSGTYGQEEPATTAAPAVDTTQPSSTTTTETLPPTTTTTEPPLPWTLIEFPSWPDPILTEDFGGSLLIETICVELDLVGFDDESSAPRDLRRLLAQLGIETVDEGCSATLEIAAVASRTAAQYRDKDSGSIRTCWAGEHADGLVSLSESGVVVAEWPIAVDEALPDDLRGCPGEDSPMVAWHWTRITLAALIDMFGPAPGVANDGQLAWGDDARERYLTLRQADDFTEPLAAGLAHPHPDVREAAARRIMNWADGLEEEPPPYPAPLWNTIPFLITCMETDEARGVEECRLATAALRQLFFRSRWEDDVPDGFDIHSQADWWALWEANPAPPEE